MVKEKKVLTPKDKEFKKLFAMAIIDISYCAMYPDSPICQEDDFEEDEVIE